MSTEPIVNLMDVGSAQPSVIAENNHTGSNEAQILTAKTLV